MERTVIKRWAPSQSVTEITSLLHRAYAELASLGFEYVAATQCELTTRERLSEGIAFVAELDGKIVGTATLYLPPNDDSDCDWYRRDDVAFFGQFAVEPSLQRCGIGGRKMAEIETHARRSGVLNLSLDTAAEAKHLTAMYAKLGFQPVATVSWPETNYSSVVLNKRL